MINQEYRKVLKNILENGELVKTGQGIPALTTMQETMRFDLGKEFPVITERDISGFWTKPIDELMAFVNGVRNVEVLEQEFNCNWWSPWATQEKADKLGLDKGDLGPASYGGAFQNFPTGEGKGFDQFENLIKSLKERPSDRTHIITPWVPHMQSRINGAKRGAVLAPCHGWIHIRVLNQKLHLHMFQRSGDVPIGVPSNMIQYSALTLALAKMLNLKPGNYYHTISDAHIYVDQIKHVEDMLSREPLDLPRVKIKPDLKINNFFEFRGEHFVLEDYKPHESINNIPVAV